MIMNALHKQPAVLDPARHATKRLLPLDCSPAKEINAMFCAVGEFADACKDYPILFVRTQQTTRPDAEVYHPVMLLSLHNNENLMVEGTKWAADRYVPAIMRGHPLALVALENDKGQLQLTMCIDESYPGLSDGPDGQPLFENGAPTELLRQAAQFLDALEHEYKRTHPFCDRLVELGLLKQMRAEGPLADGSSFAIDGFYVVDDEKLRNLPDAAVLELHRSGILGLIHLHLASMGCLQKLVDRKSARLLAAQAAA